MVRTRHRGGRAGAAGWKPGRPPKDQDMTPPADRLSCSATASIALYGGRPPIQQDLHLETCQRADHLGEDLFVFFDQINSDDGSRQRGQDRAAWHDNSPDGPLLRAEVGPGAALRPGTCRTSSATPSRPARPGFDPPGDPWLISLRLNSTTAPDGKLTAVRRRPDGNHRWWSRNTGAPASFGRRRMTVISSLQSAVPAKTGVDNTSCTPQPQVSDQRAPKARPRA